MATRLDILQVGYADFVKPSGETTITAGHESNIGAINVPTSSGQRKFMKASGSCGLVRSSQSYILFDTMGAWESALLLEKLANLKIHPEQIDYVICSHSHPDHVGNINLFTKAKKHFVGTSVYQGDIYEMDLFQPDGKYIYKSSKTGEVEVVRYKTFDLDSNVRIDPTPGHTLECVSLIVNNCEQYGSVCLSGDLFEREEDIEDESIWIEAGSQSPLRQRANRDRIYNMIDYILPGHGDIFPTLGPLKIQD